MFLIVQGNAMRYILILLTFLFSGSSLAARWGSCDVYQKEAKITLPAGRKFSIDPNLPIGSVLYSSVVNPLSGLNFWCTHSSSFSYRFGYVYGNGGLTVPMSGYGFVNQAGGNYPIYKTNIEGVGVIIKSSQYVFPFWEPIKTASNVTLDFRAPTYQTLIFDIILIKYADIPLGASAVEISSAYLPDVFYQVKIFNSNTGALPNGDVPLVRFSFNPAIVNIVTATCDTPDMTVDLGNRKLSAPENKQSGKFTTPWVDASIRLVNCPVFHGIGTGTMDQLRDNIMTVTLKPGNATTSTEGIMPVDSGSLAATGVGIQMAHGNTASWQLINFTGGQSKKTYTMSSTQGATYTIPMVARYMQTAASFSGVKAGRANGKVTYLISYY
jgi:major type 1 subunit fimbrin (pilin)